MWANSQCDGCPAEYRWCHVLNAAKFGSRALLKCRAVTLPKYDSARLGGCKVNFAPGKIPWRGKNPRKCICSVPAQEMAKHRAKFGWLPLSDVAAVMPRRKTCWNLLGCPKLPDRSRLLVGQSSPYCGDMCRRYCCLTSFFPIVDTCLSCKDIARQSCAMVPRWPIFDDFLRPVFAVSRMQHVSELHLKLALRPQHVWKYGSHPIWDGWD